MRDACRHLPAERLGGARRVPCQRDHAPRTWLVVDGSLTGVSDFEHARDEVAEVVVAEVVEAAGRRALVRALASR